MPEDKILGLSKGKSLDELPSIDIIRQRPDGSKYSSDKITYHFLNNKFLIVHEQYNFDGSFKNYLPVDILENETLEDGSKAIRRMIEEVKKAMGFPSDEFSNLYYSKIPPFGEYVPITEIR